MFKKGPVTSAPSTTTTASSAPSPSTAASSAPVAASLTNEYSFQQYNGSATWVGFLRSKNVNPESRSRHHKAKCISCGLVVDGRTPNLISHKETCVDMPAETRRLRAADKSYVPPPPTRNQSIVAAFGEVERSQEDSDYLLAMAIITGDIPYRWLQNPYLRAYQAKYETKGRTRLSDYRLRTVVLPNLAEKAKSEQAFSVEQHDNWTLSLDGWSDISGNKIVAVMMLDGTKKHYIGNLDVKPGERHTADRLVTALVSLMGDEMLKRCKAIVTDSPNVMRKLRKMICDKYPNMVNLSCALHFHNLIMQDLIKHSAVTGWAKDISRLCNFFTNVEFWKVVLRDWGEKNGQTRFLTTYVNVRWYSFVAMCMRAKSFTEGFKHCSRISGTTAANGNQLPEDIKNIISSGIFEHIGILCQLLKPFADSIACLERNDVVISDVWISIIKIRKYLCKDIKRDMLPNKFATLVDFIITRLDERSSIFDSDIYLIALYLSPTYRTICTSGIYHPLDIHKRAFNLARRWEPQMTEKMALAFRDAIQEYDKCCGRYHCRETNAIKYWGNFPNCPLGSFAAQVLKLVPTSADVERLFSKLSRTKTKFRNNLLPRNLASHGMVAVEALNSISTTEKPLFNINEELEWEFEELEFDTLSQESDDEEDGEIEDDREPEFNEAAVRFDWTMDVLQSDNESVPIPNNCNFTAEDIFKINQYS